MKRFAVVLLSAAAAFAADISGIWVGQLPGRFPGEVQDVSFKFEQTAPGKLAGKSYGENDSTPLSEVKVEDDRISFVIGNEMNGGRNKLIFTGTIKNGEIELTRRRELPPDATPEMVKRNVPVTFRLKRLI
jgi:hypothetical protein